MHAMRYHPGDGAELIDPTVALEVVDLPAANWGPIYQTYPELSAIAAQANFGNASHVVIHPPAPVSRRLLMTLAQSKRKGREIYEITRQGKLVSIVVCLRAGYLSVHIYRLRQRTR